MTESSKKTMLDDLIGKGVDFVGDLVNSAPPEKIKIDDKFNWLGLAEGAAIMARNSMLIDWADISVKIYRALRASGDFSLNHGLELSEMSLRVYMILHLGNIQGHNVLDSLIVEHWFFQTLPMSVSEAESLIVSPSNLDISLIRQLRWVKNRVRVIQELYAQYMVHSREELAPWMEIYDKLP